MSEAIPVPSKFAHLVLKTSRFKEQRKFYQDLLGARIVHEAPGIVFLSYDDEHHRLAIISMVRSPRRYHLDLLSGPRQKRHRNPG